MTEITCKKCGNAANIVSQGTSIECTCGHRELISETWSDLYAEFYQVEEEEDFEPVLVEA